MEIEKIVRIVAYFIASAAFAVWFAAVFLFPDYRSAAQIAQPLILLCCFGTIWLRKRKAHREKNTNHQ